MRRMNGLGRKAGVLVAGVSLLGLGALALGPAGAGATADGSKPSGPSGSRRPHHLGLTDAQKTCLREHGITLPTRGTPKDPTATTIPHPSGPPDQATRDKLRAQIEKYRAAALACGIKGPTFGGPRRAHPPGLTDAQKTCLREHGITLPTRGTPKDPTATTIPHPSGPPDQATRDKLRAQIEKFRAAAQACGIKAPTFGGPRGAHPPGLTDAQKTCLREHGITLPTRGTPKDPTATTIPHPSGPPDQATRDKLRADAQKWIAAAKACGLKIERHTSFRARPDRAKSS